MNTILLDGAMGTQLLARGLRLEPYAERVNLSDPEAVRDIHAAYRAAGSGLLYSCSFGVNRRKLRGQAEVGEVIAAALQNARAAADGARVGLDVGMLGELLEPYGELTKAEARELYAEIFRAGASADLVALETYFDLNEALLALDTAKELLPEKSVFVTMTFQAGGRTLTGVTVAQMARELEAAGADAIGLNCSLGPKEALPLLRELRERSALPLIAKPNAGMPDPKTGQYPLGPEEFAGLMQPILELGIRYAGGCCGTDPRYISELAKVIS